MLENLFLFYFILLAAPKKKTKVNKQTERTLAGTPQHLWPITASPDTNKKIKNKKCISKNTAIQEQLQLHTTSYWTIQGTITILF